MNLVNKFNTSLLPLAAFLAIGLGLLAPSNQLATAQDDITDDWVEVLPAGIRTKLKMPVEPKYNMRTMTPEDGLSVDFHSYMGTVEDGNLTYVFNHHQLPDTPVGKAEIRKTLDNAVQGGVLRVSGDVSKHNPISKANMKGREVVYTFADAQGNNFKIHTHFYIRGDEMYTLSVVALEDNFTEEGAQGYFDSFALINRANPQREENADN